MALQNGGAIPDLFTYAVIAEPDEKQVGTRRRRLRRGVHGRRRLRAGQHVVAAFVGSLEGKVRVENAHGQRAERCPSGEARHQPAPTSCQFEVSRLREDVATRDDAVPWLDRATGPGPAGAAELLVRYVRVAGAPPWAFRRPETACVVAERFFDEAGGMQLIHARAVRSPHQSRVGHGACASRFCRAFDFELQAAASDDGDSACRWASSTAFPLLDIFDFVSPGSRLSGC
jgi:ATP-dependent Lhr-like helicase